MSDKKEIKEKPLDKMTVKELREIAADIAEITGVSGMKKAELLEAIKKAEDIKEKKPKAKEEKPEAKEEKPKAKEEKPEAKETKPEAKEKKPKAKKEKPKAGATEGMNVKKKIQYFKTKRVDALTSGDRKKAKILRRRINRLKKKSRRAA